jgi:hypothetical protein
LLLFTKYLSKRFSLTSALASGSDQHLGEWLLGSYKLKEFLLVDLLISIHIDPPNNRKVVLFSALNPICVEKPFYVLLVDQAHRYVVNLLKGGHLRPSLLRI